MQNGHGREVVIVEAVRTPIGRGHPEKGYYKDTHPNALLAKTYTEVIERAGIAADEVEDVITGCVQQYGEQMFNVGRNAWLQAGLPVETPATTVDRQCGSAQQAVNFGAALVAAGVHDAVIGSGVEHMGHIPMGVGFKWVDEVGSPWPEELMAKYNLVPQGVSAEMIAHKGGIPRGGTDEVRRRPATKKLLERNGMTMNDIDLVEINEAFASVVAAWRRELEPDMDRVNVNGGAMALGHPLGSTGARLITTLLHELERSDKSVGLVTMCCGGGLGTGTIIERV